MKTFDAYTASIELIHALRGARVIERVKKHDRDLAKQIQRAASSVALNLSEGNRRRGGDRTHHFTIAAGSANEVKAGLEVAVAWGHIGGDQLEAVNALLDRVLAMLWRLTHPRA